jgi:hypothetical protein
VAGAAPVRTAAYVARGVDLLTTVLSWELNEGERSYVCEGKKRVVNILTNPANPEAVLTSENISPLFWETLIARN